MPTGMKDHLENRCTNLKVGDDGIMPIDDFIEFELACMLWTNVAFEPLSRKQIAERRVAYEAGDW